VKLLVDLSIKPSTQKNLILCSVTDVFEVHPQCMWHGLTVMQLGLLPNGKKINFSNLKKKRCTKYK